MPIFISYSHSDREFVNKLGAHLVKNRARVWVDHWELNVGDSLIERIQAAIEDARGLLVVLSKSSVESEWCKKELSAGLIRELEERRVIVLPVLIEDCDIPMFLRDKLYADFRSDFDDGLKVILEAIARVTSDTLGRFGDAKALTDWSIDYGLDGGRFRLRVTLIEHGTDLPHMILTEIHAIANDAATDRQALYAKLGMADFGRLLIVFALAELCVLNKVIITLPDSTPKDVRFAINDSKSGIGYDTMILSRRVGEDNGKTIAVDIAGQLEVVRDAIKATTRPVSAEEMARLQRAT